MIRITMFCITTFMFLLMITYISPNHSIQRTDSSRSTSNYKVVKRQENGEDKSQWRIIGGENCFTKERWYLVSIRYLKPFEHLCGGSAISQRWILSSAKYLENVKNIPEHMVVMLGVPLLTPNIIKNIRNVKKIIIHNDFDPKSMDNDLALVFLASNVGNFLPEDELFPKLPKGPLEPDLTGECKTAFTIAGWGQTKPKGVDKNEVHLQCVDVNYITNDECMKYTPLAYNDKVMCTLTPGGGKDACSGDEGGPLVCDGVLFGIVSWGRECGAPNSPRLYTRVDKYLQFIKVYTESYERGTYRAAGNLLSQFSLHWSILLLSSISICVI